MQVISQRAAIWGVFVGVLGVALVGFFLWRAGAGVDVTEDTSSTQAANEPPRPTVIDDGSSWLMFGAEPGLVSQAETTLTDSLSLLWRFKTGADVKSSAAIRDGRVFIGSSDENVYAIDLRDGSELWRYATEGPVEAAPSLVGDSVVVGSMDESLYALDAQTGAFKWRYETDGTIAGAANWTRSPDDETTWILIGSYDNKLHCVDAATGDPIWTYETGNYVNGSVALDDGRCAFGGCDAFMHVISIADGMQTAEIDGGSYIAASAAFVDGQIYVGNYDNVFMRADAAKGEIVWKYDQSEGAYFSAPAVTDDLVIVGGRDRLVHALRRDDGESVWTFKTLGEVDSSPAVCGDKVVVGSCDGRLYMLRLSDGKEIWSYEIGQPIISSPAVAQGVVVVGCDDGYVYAFGSVASQGDAEE